MTYGCSVYNLTVDTEIFRLQGNAMVECDASWTSINTFGTYWCTLTKTTSLSLSPTPAGSLWHWLRLTKNKGPCAVSFINKDTRTRETYGYVKTLISISPERDLSSHAFTLSLGKRYWKSMSLCLCLVVQYINIILCDQSGVEKPFGWEEQLTRTYCIFMTVVAEFSVLEFAVYTSSKVPLTDCLPVGSFQR